MREFHPIVRASAPTAPRAAPEVVAAPYHEAGTLQAPRGTQEGRGSEGLGRPHDGPWPPEAPA